MLWRAALNGPWTKDDHPAVPVLGEKLARDNVACVAAVAGAKHLDARDEHGRERLDAHVVDHVVTKVRDACGIPVGVPTGAWIEGNPERRVGLLTKPGCGLASSRGNRRRFPDYEADMSMLVDLSAVSGSLPARRRNVDRAADGCDINGL